MPEVKKIRRVLRVGQSLDSSLSSFVERPVPTDREVESFERVVKREARDQEIDSNLTEIYSDKKGGQVNVRQLQAKKRTPFFVRFFKRLLVLGVLGLAAYLAYFYFFGNSGDVSSLEFKISAPDKIMAGQEFSYQISYHNPTRYVFSHMHLELQYPDNFIFGSGSAAPTIGNYGWDLPDLAPGASGSLTVTGTLIAQADSANVIFGHLSYLPGSFSSQFRKEASASTIIGGLGFSVDLNYSNTVFLNQNNDLSLIFSNVQDNFLNDFDITFALPAESNASVATTTSVQASSTPLAGTPEPLTITNSGGVSWRVSGLKAGITRQEIPITYTIKQKSDKPEIKVRLEKKAADGQSFVFWEKSFTPELVTSNLNLALALNGSKNDNSVAFGQTLDYSLTYANMGSSPYKDVVVMAALGGDFLDWKTLADDNKGAVQNETIIWTKNEIPALGEIKPGEEGEIHFSIKLAPYRDGDLGKNMSIVSYAQYGIGSKPAKNQDNKSNTITSRISSDLSLGEQIRYFNADNLPVGSGPLPPEVGQKTSFKVYWTVRNNLHELTDARVILPLPSYVSWEGNGTTNVGSIYLDQASHQVVWEIGRLPLSVYRADAEFAVSLTPAESDRNKILIISPGSTVSAMDTETKDVITARTGAKTTKLEDDDIAGLNNSGIVK